MSKEYSTAIGWKIFVLLGSPPLIVVFSWVAYIVINKNPSEFLPAFLVLIISGPMIVVLVWGNIDMFVSKLIISKDKLVKVDLLNRKELLFKDIKGFKSEKNYVFVYPIDESKKVIRISQYYNKKEDWLFFLQSNFRDLELEEIQKEKAELLRDTYFGKNKDEIETNISRITKYTKILNKIAWIGALWLLVYPKPYEFVVAVNSILPFLGLLFIFYNRGRIKIINDEKSPYPSLSSTLSIPMMILTVRALMDYEVLDFQNAWIASILLTIVIAVFIYNFSGERFYELDLKENLAPGILISLGVGIFSFFYTVELNCTFDNSNPTIYSSSIIDKNKSTGKHTRYKLKIEDWKGNSSSQNVKVSKMKFEKVEIGDKIFVYEKQGLFGIPWFYVK